MKFTRIALSVVFLFVSIMLVMTTIRDMNKAKPTEEGGLTKIVAPAVTRKCQRTNDVLTTELPCASCAISNISSSGSTWGCELLCTNNTCDGSVTFAMTYFICRTSSGSAGFKGGATPCGHDSSDLVSTGTITATPSSKSTPYSFADGTGLLPAAFTCGRIQLDVMPTEIGWDTSGAGAVYDYGTSCAAPPAPTQPPAGPTEPPGPTSPPAPTNPPGTTPSLTPTASLTPTKTPTQTPTMTPPKTPTPTSTLTPTRTPTLTPTGTITAPSPTPTGPPVAVCAPADCGVCGWKDVGGVCREGGVLPSGRRCCYKTCVGNACLDVSGDGQDRCSADTSCVQPSSPIIASNKCDARCGICGVSDQGGLCLEQNTLSNGTKCCHQACVAQACTQVFGPGADACSDATQCSIAAVPVTVAPPTGAPKPPPPVSGFSIPWYLIAIPAVVVIIGVVL